jgi:hypothetical protein
MVRASTVKGGAPVPGATGQIMTTSAGPDITVETNLQQLLTQQTSMAMFQSTVDAPCDVKEVPLQRWVNITIVSSGRVLDVYMDGKLSRSCVLDNVLNVPRGQLKLRLGESGGFGGRYSSVQMWSQQLTPDVIYGLYQMGPTQAQHDLFTSVAKYLNLNVSFTGSAPGQPIPSGGGNPFNQLYNEAEGVYGRAAADASSAYQSNIAALLITSPRASPIGLPGTRVSVCAIMSARSRISDAALRRKAPRVSTSVVCQVAKPRSAAARASSRSAALASGSSAIVPPVAGLTTACASRPSPTRQLPSTKRARSAV